MFISKIQHSGKHFLNIDFKSTCWTVAQFWKQHRCFSQPRLQ